MKTGGSCAPVRLGDNVAFASGGLESRVVPYRTIPTAPSAFDFSAAFRPRASIRLPLITSRPDRLGPKLGPMQAH